MDRTFAEQSRQLQRAIARSRRRLERRCGRIPLWLPGNSRERHGDWTVLILPWAARLARIAARRTLNRSERGTSGQAASDRPSADPWHRWLRQLARTMRRAARGPRTPTAARTAGGRR